MPYRKSTVKQYTLPTPRVTYPRKLSPMLAQEGSKADIEVPTKEAQRKLDGTRIMIIKDGNTVKMMGARNWINDYAPRYPQIVEDVRKLPVDRCIIDGELTFFKKGTDKDVFVNALSRPEELKKLNVDVKAEIFDVLWVDDDNLEHLGFADRDEIVHTMIPRNMAHLETLKTVSKNKTAYFDQLKAREGEGVILKEKDSPYREGQRTPEWLKVKNWRSDEAVVVGYTQGQGARAGTFGALVLAQKDKTGKWKYVGKSSGLKEQELRIMLKKMQSLSTSKSPLGEVPDDLKVKSWVDPKLVVEVKYYEKTPYGIFRFPDYIRERTDKKPGDCKI